VDELGVPLRVNWGDASVEHIGTRPTACNGVFAVCPKNVTPCWEFWASRHLCVRHVYTYAHAFSKGCNHQVYEAGKNSAKKQPTGKKGFLWVLKGDIDCIPASHGEMNFTYHFLFSLQVSEPAFILQSYLDKHSACSPVKAQLTLQHFQKGSLWSVS